MSAIMSAINHVLQKQPYYELPIITVKVAWLLMAALLLIDKT